MLGTIIRKINLALLEKNFELRHTKNRATKYFLCGYKMALNDMGSWIEQDAATDDKKQENTVLNRTL